MVLGYHYRKNFPMKMPVKYVAKYVEEYVVYFGLKK